MAQWTQTLEPYIRVQERVKSATLNPTAGEDLIIGVALISDAGPSKPTLISSQSEFLSTYASQDLTQEYLESLNVLYSGADKTTASTMWANAYRLAGSNTMLVVRASKANDIFFAKPLVKGDLNTYILRDGELMKKVSDFKVVLDLDGDTPDHDSDGWNIAISGIGVLGNRTTDDGAQYDYYINNLPDLVEQLNETSKFFSPSYTFYKDAKMTEAIEVDMDDEASKASVVAVVFNEVYLGVDILDKTDSRTTAEGTTYVIICEKDWVPENPDQKLLDLNNSAWSGFVAAPFYATNVYNSATNLKVRIRRFNHDAVTNKELSESQTASLNASGASPYVVLPSVLDTFTSKGTKEPAASVLERDFYEVAVFDPSVNSAVSFFNIGNILGRGDMEVSELNGLINMIQVELPDNLRDLNLNYYGYDADDFIYTWEKLENPSDEDKSAAIEASKPEATKDTVGKIYKEGENYFKGVEEVNGEVQIFADLTIDPTKYEILSVSDTDLKKALDQIVLDEVYVTEGLCDLGNTELSYQNYMANIAINSNYFYPISTVNSTNYMTIGNSATKIPQDSMKLYMSAPWDIDTGNLGWKYYASPSVLYWEAVARNRRNNEEFRGVFGQNGGIVQYQRPAVEFNKKTRQLLLSKRVNTVLWNTQTQAWNMNDNYTKQSVDNIMSDEGNSRLMIRISKAIPILLRQFIGRKISEVLCNEVISVIDYFFKSTILPMVYTVETYQIFCDYDEVLARQNKIKVCVNVRYQRSLKYIEVYNNAYDVGMDISQAEY